MTVAKYNKAKVLGGGRIRTPYARLAFPSLFSPEKPMDPGKEGKYVATLLFDPKHVDIEPIKKGMYDCAKAKWGAKIPHSPTFDLPDSFWNPLRDGNTKPDYTGYEDKMFLKASSKFAPQVVDCDRTEIASTDEPGIYAGSYVRASISFYAFDTSGNRGITVNLHNIQKLADGEAFGGGGRVDAEDEFDDANDFAAITPSNNEGDETESWM